MNAIRRRVTTSSLLILAALSFGCGADSSSSVLPALTPTGPLGAAPAESGFSPLDSTQSAQRVAGTQADVDAANQAADAIHAILTGGALQAASPTGGAIADSSQSMQLAALQTPGESAPVASDAQMPAVSGVARLRRHLATVQGAPVFTFSEGGLHVQGPEGTDLSFTGVSQLPEVQEQETPPLGFTLSEDVHVVGRFGHDNRSGEPTQVDLKVRGVTGTLTFLKDQDPIFDLTVGQNGFAVSGTIDGISATVSVTGFSGRFTSVRELNALLAGADLKVHVTGLRARDVISEGRGDLVISSLQLPVDGDRPTGRVYGSADLAFDAKLPFTQEGKIVHAALEVGRDAPLVFDAGVDGPRSGRVVATLHHASNGKTDVLTITFRDGEPHISGSVTNVSGEAERVETNGDTTSARGTIKFRDGRATEHTVEVRRRTGGTRHIVFRVTLKNRDGVLVMNMVGAVKRDKSLSGTWFRGGAVDPVPPSAVPVPMPVPMAMPIAPAGRALGQTGLTTASPPSVVPDRAVAGREQRSGTFRVTADGTLELVAESGEVLARGSMPVGWDKGL